MIYTCTPKSALVTTSALSKGGNPSQFNFSCIGGVGEGANLENLLTREYGQPGPLAENTDLILPRVGQPCVVKKGESYCRAKILDLQFATSDGVQPTGTTYAFFACQLAVFFFAIDDYSCTVTPWSSIQDTTNL